MGAQAILDADVLLSSLLEGGVSQTPLTEPVRTDHM